MRFGKSRRPSGRLFWYGYGMSSPDVPPMGTPEFRDFVKTPEWMELRHEQALADDAARDERIRQDEFARMHGAIVIAPFGGVAPEVAGSPLTTKETMSENHAPLSNRQRQTFDAIQRHMEKNGMPPTIRELMAELKIAYPRGVQGHLEALEKKGYITRDPRASRGIRLAERFKQAKETVADLADKITRIPVLGRIPAGGPMLAEENVEDWVTLPTDLTKGKRDVFILKAQGDSMIGAGIFDGDLLIVQPQQTADNGDIVAA